MSMYKDYLAKLNLEDALWWFIENRDGIEDQSTVTEIFFYLRARYRNGK